MKVAIGAAVVVEVLLLFGLTHVKFHQAPPSPREVMRVTMPPPPPPPPEVKKLEPPPAPKPDTPKKVTPPEPTPPRPAPKPANVPAAAHPSPTAPAVATDNATDAAPTAPAAPAAPPAPPAPAAGLHGVVNGRGHCQAVEPQMPRKAVQDGISATVTAHLTIGTDGSVSDVKIVKVDPPTGVFNSAVVAAGKAYRCEKNPEPYTGEVDFVFKTTPSDE
jgi:protein TonB